MIVICFLGSYNKIALWNNYKVLKKNEDEFIILNVNNSENLSKYALEGYAALCAYDYTVETTITSIYLYTGWFMRNV